jgi:hypothetical protein
VKLTRRTSLLLLAFTVWSWIIWPTFLRNIWGDPRSFAPGPTAFLIVHVVLTVASLLFGTAIGVLGWRGYAATRPPRTPGSRG